MPTWINKCVSWGWQNPFWPELTAVEMYSAAELQQRGQSFSLLCLLSWKWVMEIITENTETCLISHTEAVPIYLWKFSLFLSATLSHLGSWSDSRHTPRTSPFRLCTIPWVCVRALLFFKKKKIEFKMKG